MPSRIAKTTLTEREGNRNMAGKLQGKVALITGASSGIGEATALALAAEGAKVAVAARRADRLQSLARRIADQGGQALPIIADVADEAQVREMVGQVHTRWQRLDILVNNAGVALIGPVERANPDDWRRMVNINLLGLMYATHAVLPIMKEQGGRRSYRQYILNCRSYSAGWVCCLQCDQMGRERFLRGAAPGSQQV
jgi:NADP-dependent 3-hydroxy acid dehydrogenase YdfG